jgi:coatomer protein complex subunit gamma
LCEPKTDEECLLSKNPEHTQPALLLLYSRGGQCIDHKFVWPSVFRLGVVEMSEKRNEDTDAREDPMAKITTSQVARDAHQTFSRSHTAPVECMNVLTQILYLLKQPNVQFADSELTSIFFGVTKLFQCQDIRLRRLVYLVLKELRVGPGETLIVVSCLMKDMTSNVPQFRANAIRVLAEIMDPEMVGQIDRLLKQAVVDRNPLIVSSTLVSGLKIHKTNPDLIKRWTNEIQEALASRSSDISQFHALALLFKIKRNDRLGLSKVVTALCKKPPRGDQAQLLHIRIITELLTVSNPPNNPLLKYLLEYAIRHSSDAVSFEAARCICSLPDVSTAQLGPAVQVLQEYLNPQASVVHRFAAVKTLSELVTRIPFVVTPCTRDLEALIGDSNRGVATMAITTLLKTPESNVERLMRTISGFINEISDEFKIVLVDSVKTLCLKHPSKYQSMMGFLSNGLREDGGLSYKTAIVDAMLAVVNEVKEARSMGMGNFCEFIEDCEWPELSIKILNYLGERGQTSENPGRLIRFIFNRVILESAAVRAAAITAIARLGASCPSLLDNAVVLLARCLNDSDDEVRDRAVFCRELLKLGSKKASEILFFKPGCNDASLELSLQIYLDKCKSDASVAQEMFSLTKDIVEAKVPETAKEGGLGDDEGAGGDFKMPIVHDKYSTVNPYLSLLKSIPELNELGDVFHSYAPVDLTEQESEYYVSCVRHTYPEHVVFQFNVENKMEDTQLEQVYVDMEPSDDTFQVDFSVSESVLPFEASGTTFVVMTREDGVFSCDPIPCVLKFTTKETDDEGKVDEDDDGDEDEYPLEEIELTESNFMKPSEHNMGLVEFRSIWENLGAGTEAVKKYVLGLDSIETAVNAVVELLGMRPCESGAEVAEGASSHAMFMAGVFFGGVDVLCRAGFMLDKGGKGVTLKVAIRSENEDLNALLVSAIR